MLLPLISIAWTSLLNALANQKILCGLLYCDICFVAVVWNWTCSIPTVCLNGFHILQKKALLGEEKKPVQVCKVGNRRTRIKNLIWVHWILTTLYADCLSCDPSVSYLLLSTGLTRKLPRTRDHIWAHHPFWPISVLGRTQLTSNRWTHACWWFFFHWGPKNSHNMKIFNKPTPRDHSI